MIATRVAVALAMTLSATACSEFQRTFVLTGAAMTLTACDYLQTMDVSDRGNWDRVAPNGGRYVELNPLYGRNPSARPLTAGVVVAEGLLAGLAVSDAPAWVKYAVIGAVAVAEGVEVARARPYAGACGLRSVGGRAAP